MRKYSVFALAREALRAHKGWEQQWTSPEPKAEYDVIIVGAGGHGLATAYYLAKEHGITNVAVLEKGWLGGGNTGRNTTIIRSNYLYDESAGIYEHAVKLWETLGARPSRLAWAEVFLGLKNGVVDAAEGPVSAAYAAKFHEAVKHVIRTDHIYSSAHITINEKAFQELSPELQQILEAAAKEAVAWSRDQSAKDTDEALGKMAAAGATLHKIDASAIQGKSQAAVADMEADGAWTRGLWQAIQDIK